MRSLDGRKPLCPGGNCIFRLDQHIGMNVGKRTIRPGGVQDRLSVEDFFRDVRAREKETAPGPAEPGAVVQFMNFGL